MTKNSTTLVLHYETECVVCGTLMLPGHVVRYDPARGAAWHVECQPEQPEAAPVSENVEDVEETEPSLTTSTCHEIIAHLRAVDLALAEAIRLANTRSPHSETPATMVWGETLQNYRSLVIELTRGIARITRPQGRPVANAGQTALAQALEHLKTLNRALVAFV